MNQVELLTPGSIFLRTHHTAGVLAALAYVYELPRDVVDSALSRRMGAWLELGTTPTVFVEEVAQDQPIFTSCGWKCTDVLAAHRRVQAASDPLCTAGEMFHLADGVRGFHIEINGSATDQLFVHEGSSSGVDSREG